MAVHTERDGPVTIVTIDRPEVRNAVDAPTAAELAVAFRAFERDDTQSVAVLTGAGGTFCAGADLKAVLRPPDKGGPDERDPAESDQTGSGSERGNRVTDMGGDGPMGPTRMLLDKPVIGAVEGHAVAGGLELAVWCDLRVAARDAVFGVFCRRWGVPLVDGGTVRLPRLIGASHALDLVLTGRGVSGDEALRMGLTNRLTEPGGARAGAVALAHEIAAHPQVCMRNDRRSVYEQWGLSIDDALDNELRLGRESIASGDMQAGVGRFVAGEGRHGAPA
jgi:enoyl-CoA hydratase